MVVPGCATDPKKKGKTMSSPSGEPIDKQWFLTKVVGVLLTLLLLISTSVGAANMFLSLKADVIRNGKAIRKNSDDVEEIDDDVRILQLTDKELEIKYAEILRRFDENREQMNILLMKLDNLERVD